MRSSWEEEWGRKLDLKARAQERTKAATIRPDTLAKKRSGSGTSEEDTAAMALVGAPSFSFRQVSELSGVAQKSPTSYL